MRISGHDITPIVRPVSPFQDLLPKSSRKAYTICVLPDYIDDRGSLKRSFICIRAMPAGSPRRPAQRIDVLTRQRIGSLCAILAERGINKTRANLDQN